MTAKREVNIGDVFCRLTIVGEAPPLGGRRAFFCDCSCGSRGKPVRLAHLVSEHTVSCGCASVEALVKRTTTHGHYRARRKSRELAAYSGMLERCADLADPDYGGRGIRVCDRWLGENGFVHFLEDMGPAHGLTIDRFPDNDGNYGPGNCRWATRTQQNRNTRANRMIEHDGVRACLAEWAERLGISQTSIANRLRRGWSTADALAVSTKAIS